MKHNFTRIVAPHLVEFENFKNGMNQNLMQQIGNSNANINLVRNSLFTLNREIRLLDTNFTREISRLGVRNNATNG